MQIAKIQLFAFMQNEVGELKGRMPLTRMAQPFRVRFKEAMGLPKRAGHFEVLLAIGYAYHQFNDLEGFFKYINEPRNFVNEKPIVTREMLTEVFGI